MLLSSREHVSSGRVKNSEAASLQEMALSQSRHNSRIKLAQTELRSISDQLSRDYAPSISDSAAARKSSIRFSPQELLAISEEISREFAVRPAPRTDRSEIVLLPVDPQHLHAYWHLDEQHVNDPGLLDTPLTLRVYAMPDGQDIGNYTPTWFDTVIDPPRSHHKVAVPDAMMGNCYAAAIGHRQDADAEHFATFARSKTAYIPRNLAGLDLSGEGAQALVSLHAMSASGRGRHI